MMMPEVHELDITWSASQTPFGENFGWNSMVAPTAKGQNNAFTMP